MKNILKIGIIGLLLIVIISLSVIFKTKKNCQKSDQISICFYTDYDIQKNRSNSFILIKNQVSDSLLTIKVDHNQYTEKIIKINYDTMSYYFGEILKSKLFRGNSWESSSESFDKQKMTVTREYDTIINEINYSNCFSITVSPLTGQMNNMNKIEYCVNDNLLLKLTYYQNGHILAFRNLDSINRVNFSNLVIIKSILQESFFE